MMGDATERENDGAAIAVGQPERASSPAERAWSQAERSERTRAALLRAAEAIFARDGFEASRIEDIATEAGRSRGAFYANFASKAEVFLALRSLAIRRRAVEVRERLAPIRIDQPGGEQARHQAVVRYILEQICDTRTLLLEIEFKLFALRHPEMLKELAARHLDASTTVNRVELADLFLDAPKTVEQMEVDTLAVEAILEGFALNAMFCPTVLDGQRLSEIVPGLLDRIVQHK